MMKGILTGLQKVHEKNYIHRDIKPENIQLAPVGMSNEGELKIVDFGFGAVQRMGIKNTHEEKIGTALYMAPEQISSQRYSKKIDIYASGIILYTMLVGYHPLYINGGMLSDNTQSLKHKVAAIDPAKWHYPSYISKLAKNLIVKLCKISQIERYDAKRALHHPWITRRLDDDVPLTASEEIQHFNLEGILQKSIKLVHVLSILKNGNKPIKIDQAYLSRLKDPFNSSVVSSSFHSPKSKKNSNDPDKSLFPHNSFKKRLEQSTIKKKKAVLTA